MDTWSEKQMNMMKFGGNKNARLFFEKYGVAEISDLTKKYESQAAVLYKKKILTLATVGFCLFC